MHSTNWWRQHPLSTLKCRAMNFLMVRTESFRPCSPVGNAKISSLFSAKTASQTNVSLPFLTPERARTHIHIWNTQVVRVTYIPTDFSVLVRAYGKGSELIIDRKQEIIVSAQAISTEGGLYWRGRPCYQNLVTLSAQGLCPPLYARFRNGLMYGFIKGRVSTVEEMGCPKTALWIARQLAKWHKVRLPQTGNNKTTPRQTLWDTMWNWYREGRRTSKVHVWLWRTHDKQYPLFMGMSGNKRSLLLGSIWSS